jgi:hypothetical protein
MAKSVRGEILHLEREQLRGYQPGMRHMGWEERFIAARFGVMVQRSSVRRPRKEEERFLSAQADRFAGAKREEKVGLLRSK